MHCLGFKSTGEVMLFVTSLVAGMTIIIGINAVNATPKFMLDYYKYTQNDKDAVPRLTEFWNKILTYYTLVTAPVQLFLQPLNLTPFFRRFSLMFRIELGNILMLIELLIICLMPHTGASEESALAGIVSAAFVGGVGRSLFENAVYALLGPCPPKMIVASMIGLPTSAVLMSIVQITLLATMNEGFYAILRESIIYFSISIVIVLTSSVLFALLVCNSFARKYIVELRSKRSMWRNIYTLPKELKHRATEYVHEDNNEPNPLGLVVVESKMCEPDGEANKCGVQATSTAELLSGISLLGVMKKNYHMLISCFLSFFVTCLLFPGVLIQVDITDVWYITTIIATFNVTDLISRVLNMFETLQISPRNVLLLSASRIVFIPIMILFSKHVFRGKVIVYVLTVLLGLTGGYTGSASMMYAASLPELKDPGERSMAGQICDISLLIGVSAGIFLQIFALG